MEVISHLIESDTLYYKAFSELLAIKKTDHQLTHTEMCIKRQSVFIYDVRIKRSETTCACTLVVE